jgi:hypothetical protein
VGSTSSCYDACESAAPPGILPPVPAIGGIWISGDELAQIPMAGTAWDALWDRANQSAGTPDLSNQDQMNNVYVMAKALVFARTGQERFRSEVCQQLEAAIGTESGGRTLALGRELAAYVISADLIDLPDYDPTFDRSFRQWLDAVRRKSLSGKTLISTHESRPNNWGTHAGASRIAVARYLGDTVDLQRAAMVFKGFLGDRSTYAGFTYGSLSWQCDSSRPVGINPTGCTRNGHQIDGALPDDMRRGSSFTWPPNPTGYAWEALQGVTVQAELLHRAGFAAWEWENRAVLRAVEFLDRIGWNAEGDDQWEPWLINYAYGTSFSSRSPARPGKNLGWTDWTHGPGRRRR